MKNFLNIFLFITLGGQNFSINEIPKQDDTHKKNEIFTPVTISHQDRDERPENWGNNFFQDPCEEKCSARPRSSACLGDNIDIFVTPSPIFSMDRKYHRD